MSNVVSTEMSDHIGIQGLELGSQVTIPVGFIIFTNALGNSTNPPFPPLISLNHYYCKKCFYNIKVISGLKWPAKSW